MKSNLALALLAVVASTGVVMPAQEPSRREDQPSSFSRTEAPSFVRVYRAEDAAQTVPSPNLPVQTRPSPDPNFYPTLPPVPPGAPPMYVGTVRGVGWGGPGATVEERNLAHEADQVARQIGDAKSDSERDQLRSKLLAVLEKQFDQRQKRHEQEIAALEAQVKKLKDLVARRQENRRDIIGRRAEQILREAQGLGW
jgi:hypothetical protein